MDKFEERLAVELQHRDQRLKEFLLKGPIYARPHAGSVAAIVLSGQPRIDEPLAAAWLRAVQAYGIRGNDRDEVARKLHSEIVAERGPSTFTEIFKEAPIWLLQFTGLALDARLLKFELPDISQPLAWGSVGFGESCRWPRLPLGTIAAGDPIPQLDPRRVMIALCCMLTIPSPDIEDLVRPQDQSHTRGRADELELVEMAVELEMNPDRHWSSYEKRRVRKLCDRIFGRFG